MNRTMSPIDEMRDLCCSILISLVVVESGDVSSSIGQTGLRHKDYALAASILAQRRIDTKIYQHLGIRALST